MSDESTTSVDALTAVGEPNELEDRQNEQTETKTASTTSNEVHRAETAVDPKATPGKHGSDPRIGGNSGLDNDSERHTSDTGRGNDTDRTDEQGQQSNRDPDGFRQWCADTSEALADADSARVDVYVRSMLPSPGAKKAQMTVLDNVSALCDGTPIDDTTVHVWGERICLCDSCRELDAGALMIDTVRELENWGGEFDASVEPFFERTRQQSSLVEDTYEGIVPPRVTAVFYVDGSLHGVFPSRFADEPYSVSDFYRSIRALTETGRGGSPSELDRGSDPAEPTQ